MKKANVFRLMPAETLPEQTLDVSHLSGLARHKADQVQAAIDLSGKRKVLFAVGMNGTGKTTLLRWACEKALAKDGPAPALATCDPLNRELRQYFDGVHSPEGAATIDWLPMFLSWLMTADCSGAIDMGGGDTALAGLARSTPGLAGLMEEAGLAPVLCVLLTPRVADLTVLAALDEAGFQPAATMLVLNQARARFDGEAEWVEIRAHSTYRAALARGAAEVWMPRNWGAGAVERRRIGFAEAAGDGSPLGVLDRSRNLGWLADMDAAFAGVSSWLI
jgi:hypothetical protein